MSLVIFILGLILVALSFPRISNFFFSRLMNEGLLTPKQISPQKAELIKFAGPNLSLFVVGMVLMLLGIILRES